MLNSIKIVCMCSWDELQAVPSMHRLCFNAATKYFMLFKKCYAFAGSCAWIPMSMSFGAEAEGAAQWRARQRASAPC
eukprot:scaffold7282_cov113-Isochrysis_galbana.AAC.4